MSSHLSCTIWRNPYSIAFDVMFTVQALLRYLQ
uniref:Uncharacterized protein n=1 Tax=Anguilla anguilla TaxID=7936 RepID=A0A0E9PWK9_ANGAN